MGLDRHYTWSVFHDIPGLMAAMGGAKAMEERLDAVFASPPEFDGSFWKEGCTHEVREMIPTRTSGYASGAS